VVWAVVLFVSYWVCATGAHPRVTGSLVADISGGNLEVAKLRYRALAAELASLRLLSLHPNDGSAATRNVYY
jgi:hypothetical protein